MNDETVCSLDGLTAKEHDKPHPFTDPFEEWIPTLGFEQPKVELKENKITVSWQPNSYEELDAFCLHHYGKKFIDTGLTYEQVVKTVLQQWQENIKSEIGRLGFSIPVEGDNGD